MAQTSDTLHSKRSSMEIKRRESHEIRVRSLAIGGENPIRVQSMTDTRTAEVASTVRQIHALANEGSELVRIAILDSKDAGAVMEIRSRLDDAGCFVPLVGDFHFDGHRLLEDHPACARVLDKYRINPGNLGFGNTHDEHFTRILDVAIANGKAIRIGANWGSLDDAVKDRLLSEHPQWPMNRLLEHAMLRSTLDSAEFALAHGLPEDRMILSAKVSHIPTLIAIYRALAARTTFPLHLGLTEAGTGDAGIIASTVAMTHLLSEGIGDTLRVSVTPGQDRGAVDPRIQEVRACQHILQANALRRFVPTLISCPGCGRTDRVQFQSFVHAIETYVVDHAADWRTRYPGSENLVIAVMGCVVNGIKEAQHADIGISLPGRGGRNPHPTLFVDGRAVGILRGANPQQEFIDRITAFLDERVSS